jgi:hypothetical protein
MIRGSVRMIDEPAQSTGLVVKVDDQRHELCFGNRIYRIHTLRSYVWLMRTFALRLEQRGPGNLNHETLTRYHLFQLHWPPWIIFGAPFPHRCVAGGLGFLLGRESQAGIDSRHRPRSHLATLDHGYFKGGSPFTIRCLLAFIYDIDVSHSTHCTWRLLLREHTSIFSSSST